MPLSHGAGRGMTHPLTPPPDPATVHRHVAIAS